MVCRRPPNLPNTEQKTPQKLVFTDEDIFYYQCTHCFFCTNCLNGRSPQSVCTGNGTWSQPEGNCTGKLPHKSTKSSEQAKAYHNKMRMFQGRHWAIEKQAFVSWKKNGPIAVCHQQISSWLGFLTLIFQSIECSICHSFQRYQHVTTSHMYSMVI